jgi:hypothetical protein
MVFDPPSSVKRIPMNLLQKLFGGSSVNLQKRDYTFSVKCNRCGEILEACVNLDNDLSIDYEDGGDIYHARKILMGENKCFQRVEVELKFSSNRELLEKHITGGEFL